MKQLFLLSALSIGLFFGYIQIAQANNSDISLYANTYRYSEFNAGKAPAFIEFNQNLQYVFFAAGLGIFACAFIVVHNASGKRRKKQYDYQKHLTSLLFFLLLIIGIRFGLPYTKPLYAKALRLEGKGVLEVKKGDIVTFWMKYNNKNKKQKDDVQMRIDVSSIPGTYISHSLYVNQRYQTDVYDTDHAMYDSENNHIVCHAKHLPASKDLLCEFSVKITQDMMNEISLQVFGFDKETSQISNPILLIP